MFSIMAGEELTSTEGVGESDTYADRAGGVSTIGSSNRKLVPISNLGNPRPLFFNVFNTRLITPDYKPPFLDGTILGCLKLPLDHEPFSKRSRCNLLDDIHYHRV